MIDINAKDIALVIDEEKLKTLQVRVGEQARELLATLWQADSEDLLHYQAIFFDKSLKSLTENDSFVTLSFNSHGYVVDVDEHINLVEAQKQIEIDLEIINRESQWNDTEAIYFGGWWPKPTMDVKNRILEFGVSLKDFHQQVFNRTLNRLFLTRYGHLLLNYSLSEISIANTHPLSYYQEKLNEISATMTIAEGYRYEDIDEDSDMPSRSRLINLILSSEIF